MNCKHMELITAGWCTRKWMRFDQTIRNLICSDLGIPRVVIQLRGTRLKKTRAMYLDLFEGRGEKRQCDSVYGLPLDDWANAGLC